MKKILLFFIGILFSGLAFADGITVKVVDRLVDATGTDTYIYCKADGKIYAYNTKGEYELYGEYSKVNTLQTAGADLEIEYIETTTDMATIPYINTGYIHKANTRIEMECNVTDNTFTNYEALFGARSWTTGEAMVFFWRFGGNNHGCFAVNDREESGDEMAVFPTDEDIKVVAEGNLVDVYTMDDLDTPWLNIQNQKDQIDGQREMYLFDLNNNNKRDNSPSFMKLYSCKIYEGDVLVMDLVPIVTGDGRSGLKDKVSGQKFFSPNNVNFAVSPDGEEALSGAGITAYEGKLVCLTTNNHEYKYTNGEWVDCGMMALTPIEDSEYKEMSTWICPSNKIGCFDWYFYDEALEENYLNYTGGGMWEPLVKEIKVVPGETYNYSFDYEGQEWGSWTNAFMKACITSSRPATITDNNYFVNGGDNMSGHDVTYGTIAWAELPRTEDTMGDPRNISMDFTATQDHYYLVFNFGLVEDNKTISFVFSRLQVAKYDYAETYSYAPQIAAQVALAQDFLANNTTTAALKNQLNAEITKAQGIIASGTNEEQAVEYFDFVKLFDQVKANNFSGDVWTKTMALAKKEKAAVSEFEAYLNTGTESTYDAQLNGLRIARKANLIETGEFTGADGAQAAEGDYYLYNVGKKAFLVGGSDWGAHAAIGWPGIKITLEAPEEGEGFYINTHMWNCDWAHSEYGEFGGTEQQHQGNYMGGSAYLDSARFPWKFKPVDGKAGVYNIVKETETEEGITYQCLGYNPYSRTDAGNWPCYTTVGAYETDLSNENNQWILIHADIRTRHALEGTAKEPGDLSYLIKMPNFSQREYSNQDIVEIDNGDGTKTQQLVGWRTIWNCNNGGNLTDRNGRLQNISGDLAYDAYEHSDGDMISQIVEVPADGYYGITLNALCRPGRLNELVEQIQNGEEPIMDAFLFVDDVEKELPLFNAAADMAPGYGQATAIGEVPTTHVQAINYFQNGLYKMELITNRALQAGEELYFGLNQYVNGAGTSYWVMADNFRLKYYGEVDPSTGVEKVETDKVEGINDGKYYTLQGYAVERPTKRGIYIRNGKKVVIK